MDLVFPPRRLRLCVLVSVFDARKALSNLPLSPVHGCGFVGFQLGFCLNH